jgi:hypothetical protein
MRTFARLMVRVALLPIGGSAAQRAARIALGGSFSRDFLQRMPGCACRTATHSSPFRNGQAPRPPNRQRQVKLLLLLRRGKPIVSLRFSLCRAAELEPQVLHHRAADAGNGRQIQQRRNIPHEYDYRSARYACKRQQPQGPGSESRRHCVAVTAAAVPWGRRVRQQ